MSSAARDAAIVGQSRASHFNVLISDDEEVIEEAMSKVSLSAMETGSSHPVISPNPDTERAAEANAENRDWSIKANRKQQARQPNRPAGHGSRNTGSSNYANYQQRSQQNSLSHPHQQHSGHATHKKQHHQALPVNLEDLNEAHTLEICGFPATWRTSDLRRILSAYEGHYRLKWQNDNSCWVHFDEVALATAALADWSCEDAKLRQFKPENIIASTPKSDLQAAPEMTLEVFGFPSSWRSADFGRLLASFAGHYRLKWLHDSNCLVVFDSAELAQAAVKTLATEESLKVKPYVASAANSSANCECSPSRL